MTDTYSKLFTPPDIWWRFGFKMFPPDPVWVSFVRSEVVEGLMAVELDFRR